MIAVENRRIFSGIYQHLLALVGPGPSKTVLICSANSGEGTTSVATGLAIVAPEQGAGPVLLIDGNFHSPNICRVFGAADNTGLGDLLAGNREARAVVQATTIANLSIMGVGVVPPDHIQALEPMKFRGLLEKLAGSFRFILVDGPPINTYPESLLYASQVDRVLLVIHAGKTRVPVVAKALSKLSAAGCDKVEPILNRRAFVIPQAIYEKL
jgi:protein-tyrosine kinase